MPVLATSNNNIHWFMPSTKTKCYSYIRWSSDKQAKGSSYSRQLQYAKTFAAKNNLELIEIVDSGISAFKGKNATDGELGRFIDAVENKLIPSNSWLIVENLDRLSRQNPRKANRLFTDIIELGITIVTAMDDRVYDLEKIDKHPFELIASIMLFSRAHDESSTKSKRTYGNALAIMAKHNKGERVDGHAIAIKSVGTNMWWSDCSDGSVRKHAVYFDIAQKMVAMAIDGMGSFAITKYLNATYPNALPKTKNNPQGIWSLNRANQFFVSRTLLGEKRISIDGIEHILKDYYPAVCSEDTFYKMRSMRQGRNVKPEHTDKVYLFLGSDIIYCGHCGSKMTSQTSNKKVVDGKVVKYDKFRYKCSSGANATGKCRAWTFNALWLDDVVVRLAANHIFRPHSKAQDFDLALKGFEANLADKQSSIDNLITLAKQGLAPKSVLAEITQLEIEVEQLSSAIESAKLSRQSELTEAVEWGEVDERVLDYNQHELRQKLKDKVRVSVKRVLCQQIRPRLVKFTITFINDITIVAYRTPMTLVFDGIAWGALGDFYKSPVAVSVADKFKYRIVSDTDDKPVDKNLLKEELGDLAEFVIDAPVENIGINDTYPYNGLSDVSVEMMTLLKTGNEPKQLVHDLTRVEHLTDWANGFNKDVPKIIEDQFRVYKHKYKSHIATKIKPAVNYMDEVSVGKSGALV